MCGQCYWGIEAGIAAALLLRARYVSRRYADPGPDQKPSERANRGESVTTPASPIPSLTE